jgi:hypothetical protein
MMIVYVARAGKRAWGKRGCSGFVSPGENPTKSMGWGDI